MEAEGIAVEQLGPEAESEAEEIRHLLNGELGEPLYAAEAVVDAAGDETAIVMFVRQDGKVAAAGIARVLLAEDEAYYWPFGGAAQILFRDHTVGSLEALAVRSGNRRRGFGARLVTARVDWLGEHGCDRVVALSWLSGRPGTSAPLYRRLGFREGATVADFYFEESRRDGWLCPVCGTPCHCAAQLFWLELPRERPTPG